MKDTAAIRATNLELEDWLAGVDKSGLPGNFKAWIYQHGILPQIIWPLLIYEVPISTIEGFERRVSRFLRKWLGLLRSLSSIALYGQNNKLKLPISSLNEEFKVGHAREVLQYRESQDSKVSQAGIEAVYDVLPSPSNLFSWGLVESPACNLCLKRGTLDHILSCCLKALGEVRSQWRHDQVLKAIANTISCGIGHCKRLRPVKNTIAFVRAGEKPPLAARATSYGLLATA
ncbi:hypothetical protein PO909_003607 [Leuciscus waleckii]